ncbi:unnamed protein product [Gongylonema pulchrum]|uniref:non-specific serine/threonine protein kinase n=1 Tax=Gongylonema pulchrum TaxID=637853 RepID=A0A183DYU2_9BILA|nr:unnamed protein product [Gongylonema pulchrum]
MLDNHIPAEMEGNNKCPSPLIRCQPVTASDKRKSDFMIQIENGSEMQKKFSDLEKLYDALRQDGLIPDSTTPPPKRKFLEAETKLTDRRKVWIRSFVYLAKRRATQKIYAVKVMSKEHIKLRNEVKHIMAERNVLISNVNHPFLVALHYSFQTKDKLYFVLDYLNGGEVSYIRNNFGFK